MGCDGCDLICKWRGKPMAPRHVQLCSGNRAYAEAWDRAHGVVNEDVIPDSFTIMVEHPATKVRKVIRKNSPGKSPRITKPAPGLGDVVESALTAVGITSARVETWLGKKCNCKSRKEKLNKLSKWANQVLTSTTKDAESHGDSLERIVGKKKL
jgi:hypothetical protein